RPGLRAAARPAGRRLRQIPTRPALPPRQRRSRRAAHVPRLRAAPVQLGVDPVFVAHLSAGNRTSVPPFDDGRWTIDCNYRLSSIGETQIAHTRLALQPAPDARGGLRAATPLADRQLQIERRDADRLALPDDRLQTACRRRAKIA